MKDDTDLEIASVVKVAKAAELYSSSILTPHARQSLPIPVFAEEKLYMGFLYAHTEIVEAGKGLQIWAPSYLAFVDAHTCEFEKMAAVNPAVFGCPDPGDKPIGSYLAPVEQQKEEYLTNKVRLMQSYDEVLGFYLQNMEKQSPRIEGQRRNFVQLFSAISESCLHPYYRAVGLEFFKWVGVFEDKT